MKIIKMKPSHVPVLKAIIKNFAPRSCIEFGSGLNSTPILAKIGDFQTIEHGKEWGQQAIKAVGSQRVKTMPLKFAYNIYPQRIRHKTRLSILADYRKLARDVDLVFIDTYAGTRDLALLAMWGHFKIAALHDTQKAAYGYQKVIDRMAAGDRRGLIQIQCRPTNKEPFTDVLYYGSRDDATRLIDEIDDVEYPFRFTVRQF